MLEEIIRIDKELFLFLNGLGRPFWDGFWAYLSRTLSLITIPIYAFVLFCSYRAFGLKKMAVMIAAIALALICTEQLSIFFKSDIGRLRPCHDEDINSVVRLVNNHCGGRFGFFSAHAANSFAFASFFSVIFMKKNKWMGFFLITWALLVSYSRIYLGVHFPLDVLTGIVLGIFFGGLFANLFKKIKIKS